ncbi:acyl-CoA thioesterase [Defluviimonas salinarum]|uniref:Acyl-CoA thioesterase n=1 Tax=Defluviimonas salinarum TaxID=2992147 RepID=A0ABT3J7Z7_9RHOB|nr:acyl-CoA thioesterase [Defluviimonas salinarum]MCW3783813.1 acyl-CoA thioesterase [Defluviimonas salinarum]
MYPFVRMAKELWTSRRQPRLGLTEPHVSHHICWPWDLDLWVELNNGRTLTLFDLGRIPLAMRTGLVDVLRRKGWSITVAGNSLRYRRRVRMFDRVEMVSRCIGWDERFLYMEQSMWRGDDCTSHMLLRSAVTSRAGIVPPAEVLAALGRDEESPELPGWVRAWIAADATRPWPPERALSGPPDRSAA